MKRLGCFLVLLLALLSTPGYAGDFTLFGGFQREGKITLNSATQGATSFALDPKNFGVFGIRAGSGKKIFGHEHTFAYSSNFIDSNSKAWILNSNLVLKAPLPVVKPYATAGIGMIRVSGSGPTSIGTKFAMNYGGGVKVTLLGPVGGRLDVRGYTIPKVQGHSLNVLEVSLGVAVGF